MKKFTTILCLLCTLTPFSLIRAAQLDAPESVVHDFLNNRYLISNVGSGDIIARAMDGTLNVFNDVTSVSIRGITLVGDTLFAAGNEGLMGFDLATGNNILTVAIPEGLFLNDIAADTSGNVYISDGDILYQIDPLAGTYFQFLTTLSGSNGIYFDEMYNRLLVTQEDPARLSAINLDDKTVTDLVNTPAKMLDGLTMDAQRRVYVTSWETDKVYQFEPDFSNAGTEIQSTHDGPADLCFDFKRNALVVPNMSQNTISVIDMPFVKLKAPNGGEEWIAGSTQNIMWEQRDVANIKLEYSVNNGETFTSITESTSASTGTFAWNLPEMLSDQCLVKITVVEDNLLSDHSDSLFAITAKPLVKIEIAPDDTTIRRSEKLELKATGLDADGKEMDFTPKWTATGGTIETGGLKSAVDPVYAVYTPNEVGYHIVVCTDSITGVSDTAKVTVIVPTLIDDNQANGLFLGQNYPNPFSEVTTIEYGIPTGEDANQQVSLKIYDQQGTEVFTLVYKKHVPGIYRINLSTNKSFSPGIYYYKLDIGKKYSETRKMIIH